MPDNQILEASDSLISGVTFNDTNCTVSWVEQTAHKLDRASRSPPAKLPDVLPADTVIAILSAATTILSEEPTLVTVQPPDDVSLTVVGDLHGAYHDFLHMLRIAGEPSPTSWYIFNGTVTTYVSTITLAMHTPSQVTMWTGASGQSSC